MFIFRATVRIYVLLMMAGAPLIFSQGAPGQTSNVEITYVEFGRFGFTPKLVKRKAGKHYFYVRNNARRPSLTFRLARENGPVVKEVRIDAQRRDWKELVDLPLGKYIVTDVDNPANTLVVEVTN